MKTYVQLFLLLAGLSALGQKRICITIDDLPVVDYGLENYDEVTNGILKSLKKHDVLAIGYVNENKLYQDGAMDSLKFSLLEQWLEGGHELGNHSYSHLNYHRVGLEKFSKDVLKGEQIIKPLSEKYGKSVRYFRHPFLRSGANKASSDSLKSFLANAGYIEAPVTIDNEEYLFAKAFAIAFKKEDTVLMKKIGDSYLDYMMQQVTYYEGATYHLLGRQMNHILLIHANYLNAIYLDDLLELLKERGYRFITQSEALKDPAYQLEVTRFGDWGISWLQRWGMSQGMTGDFYKGEAVTPAFIRDLAN